MKVLSYEQIADLRAGRGMGLALPAELNGYPGPIHVLELGDQLRLTEEQRNRVQELHAAIKAEAIPLGERLITQQDALRLAHLRFHLSTLTVLTPEQVRRYRELRGYQAAEGYGHGSKGQH